MFGQFLLFLVLGTLLFLAITCGLLLIAYRHRQAKRSAPPMLWGLNDRDDFVHAHSPSPSSHRRLIATIGYADRSKLVTRN